MERSLLLMYTLLLFSWVSCSSAEAIRDVQEKTFRENTPPVPHTQNKNAKRVPASHSLPCKMTVKSTERFIVRHAQRKLLNNRKWIAKRLAPRILIEAKRHNLDPKALLAVAWVESDFNIWATGKAYSPNNRSVGVWQLIQYDSPVRKARRALDKGAAPDIRMLRHRTGPFSKYELRNNIKISTWVAGYEISLHVKYCKRRHPAGHFRRWKRYFWFYFMRSWAKRNPTFDGKALSRIVHFNGGPKHVPKDYARKLFKRYERVSREICNGL